MSSTLATVEQVATWLQVSPSTLRRWRKNGTGPRYIREGRTIRYAWQDVHSWAAARRTR